LPAMMVSLILSCHSWLLNEHACVDGERDPGDIPSLVRRQKEQGVRNIDRLYPWNRKGMHALRHFREFFPSRVIRVGKEQFERCFVHDHRRIHLSRMDTVHSDLVWTEF